jgi:hypothetical protein
MGEGAHDGLVLGLVLSPQTGATVSPPALSGRKQHLFCGLMHFSSCSTHTLCGMRAPSAGEALAVSTASPAPPHHARPSLPQQQHQPPPSPPQSITNRFTEADLRLFPTIVRFDAVYAGIFRCGRRRVADHPHLAAWMRDVHQIVVPGGGMQVRAAAPRVAWGLSWRGASDCVCGACSQRTTGLRLPRKRIRPNECS